MTRLGIVTDVHGDAPALEDALARMDEMGCDPVVCVGDVVGYGLHPQEVVDLLRARRIACVRGNHDRWSVGAGSAGDPYGYAPEPYDATGWDLDDDAVRFLATLPATRRTMLEGVRLGVAHAVPNDDMHPVLPADVPLGDAERWLNALDADVMITGHSHLAFELRLPDDRRIVNPGALLRDPLDRTSVETSPTLARSGRIAWGCFAVLELPSRDFQVFLARDGRRVDVPRYNIDATGSRRRP